VESYIDIVKQILTIWKN